MSQILLVVNSFNVIWLLVALLVLAGGALECERWWTRTRRRRGAAPGAAAYALDGVVIVSLVACAGVIVTLLFQGLMALFALAGNLFGWASANPTLPVVLVIGAIVIASVVFVLRRGGIGASRNAGVTPPTNAVAAQQPAGMISALPPTPRMASHNLADHSGTATSSSAPAPRVDRPVEQRSAYAPIAAETLAGEPAFAMLQQRRQYVAAPQPASFLDLAEARPTESAASSKRRRSFAPALATLVVVGALTGGAVLFRQQVSALFSGTRAAPIVVATSISVPLGESGAGASANVAAAVASPVAVEPAAAMGRVKSDSLNVRVSPGTDQAIVVVLAKGDAVTLLNETREIQGEAWVKVRIGEREGWVNQKLLE